MENETKKYKELILRKILRFLFPVKGWPCKSERQFDSKDELRITSTSNLSWADRIRVLITGRVVTLTCTDTENEIGKNVTSSTMYIGTKYD